MASKTIWRLSKYGEITAFECAKETPKFVFIVRNTRIQQEAKTSRYYQYFNSRREAVAEELKRQRSRVKTLMDQIECARARIARAETELAEGDE